MAKPFLICLLVLAVRCLTSCSDTDEYPPENCPSKKIPTVELKTTVDMGSISTFQTILQGSGQDGFLYLWQWPDLNAEAQKVKVDLWFPRREYSLYPRMGSPTLPLNRGSTLMASSSQAIYASHEDENTSIVLRNINKDHEVKRWSLGKEWYCELLRCTRNGKHTALFLRELYRYVVKDSTRNDEGRYRFSIIDPQSDEIPTVGLIYTKELLLPSVHGIAVSEDGKFFVAVGTNSGGWIYLADVTEKRALWQKVPHGDEVPHGIWTVNFNDVCFSPDSKRIYVAGNCGLFCFDVATGKILSQWQIGGRFMSVDVSPDGRLVAGGTSISGFVYIYETRTGKLLLKLITGQYSIYSLAFSPDSSQLATSGALKTNIKIWEMPFADSQGAKPQQSVNR